MGRSKWKVTACDRHRTDDGNRMGWSRSGFNSSPGYARPRVPTVSGINLFRDKLSETISAADTVILFVTIRELLGRFEQHEDVPQCKCCVRRAIGTPGKLWQR